MIGMTYTYLIVVEHRPNDVLIRSVMNLSLKLNSRERIEEIEAYFNRVHGRQGLAVTNLVLLKRRFGRVKDTTALKDITPAMVGASA